MEAKELEAIRKRDGEPVGDAVDRATLGRLYIEAAGDRHALLAEVDRLRGLIDEDVGHMQQVVYDELCRGVKYTLPDADLSRIDGAASDGDEFEFTRAEVSIALAMVEDEVDRLRTELAQLKAAARGVLSLTGDETEGERDAAWGKLGTFVGEVSDG